METGNALGEGVASFLNALSRRTCGFGEELDEIDYCFTCDCSGGSDYRKCDDFPIGWPPSRVVRCSGGRAFVCDDSLDREGRSGKRMMNAE